MHEHLILIGSISIKSYCHIQESIQPISCQSLLRSLLPVFYSPYQHLIHGYQYSLLHIQCCNFLMHLICAYRAYYHLPLKYLHQNSFLCPFMICCLLNVPWSDVEWIGRLACCGFSATIDQELLRSLLPRLFSILIKRIWRV